jgi:uncharacterized protein with GYD domain
MRTYISLLTFTQQGIQNVKQQGARIDVIKEAYRAAGGELVAYYPTMGHYDGVAIYRMPDDATAARLILATMSKGSVRSETLRAFDEDEYREILDGLPAG